MSAREALVFERALWMCAHEYGNTREQMLDWLNCDEDWKGGMEYPKASASLIGGVLPFIQVTRTTHIPHELAPPP